MKMTFSSSSTWQHANAGHTYPRNSFPIENPRNYEDHLELHAKQQSDMAWEIKNIYY